MEAIFFEDGEAFRNWLEEHHDKEKEILVGFYKVKTGKKSINWSDAVDQALCFGWIDGVMRSIDDEKYVRRFTPRKPDSNWSAINIAKVAALAEKGLMKPAGIEAFQKRKPEKSATYSFERELEFDPTLEKIFRSNKKAWDFFSAQPPGYRKKCVHYIMSAKQEKTRLSRLEKLIDVSGMSERLNW